MWSLRPERGAVVSKKAAVLSDRAYRSPGREREKYPRIDLRQMLRGEGGIIIDFHTVLG